MICQIRTKHLITFLHSVFFLLNGGSAKLIDLTHQLTADIPVFPTVTRFNFTKIFSTTLPYWIASNSYCSGEHAGTHLDAPYHFAQEKWKVHEIPIDRLVAPAVVINISGRIENPEKYELTLDDIVEWERIHGVIPRNSIIFLFSGWDQYWGNEKKYIFNNKETAAEVRTPGFSSSAVGWLIRSRQIVGIGVDTASVEVGMPADSPVHRIVSVANVYCLENVAGLSQLPPAGATVYAFPINIKNGTGAPARIIASVPEKEKKVPFPSNDVFDSLINIVDTWF